MRKEINAIETEFSERCKLALTHPATTGAVALLLANDLILKALWPDTWATGKLSNLAWVTFAPPLMAFLLSLGTQGKTWAENTTLVTAYVGLPALYAAFNTFKPLHDWIISRLLWMTDSRAGSPLDPTDSLVIPVGLAIAAWVWRQGNQQKGKRPGRMWLPIATAAAVATVATTPSPGPSPTIWQVGTLDDNTLVMETPSKFYESTNGGLDWEQSNRVDWKSEIAFGSRTVETPEGRYTIEDTDIIRHEHGPTEDPQSRGEVIYSTNYLRKESNQWFQETQAKLLMGDRNYLYGHVDPAEPVNLIHDRESGNIIASMHFHGALVMDPDGSWEQVPVGEFVPIDFSFINKAQKLMSKYFWPTTLAVCLGFTATALPIPPKTISSSDQESRRPYFSIRKLVSIILATGGIILGGWTFPPLAPEPLSSVTGDIDKEPLLLTASYLLTAGALATALPSTLKNTPLGKASQLCGLALLIMVTSILLVSALWLTSRLNIETTTVSGALLLSMTTAALRWNLMGLRGDKSAHHQADK